MFEEIATTNDKINFITTGLKKGATVVLLHPMGMDLTLWGDQIIALKDRYNVVALDLPGHGLSGKPANGHSFQNVATLVADFIERLDAGPVHLAGISYGGMIAQEIAISKPQFIRSLVLIATACTFELPVRNILKDRAEFVRKNGIPALSPLSLARWFTPEFSADRPDIIDRITKLLYLQDAEYHALIWDAVSALDTEDRLRNLTIPALIIVGDKDASTPLASSKLIAAALKTDNVHVIKDVAHFPIIEAPEIVSNLLVKFFAAL